MQKITEVAKSFEQHAKIQNEAIEKAVKAEFERLKSVIEEESKSAQSTYENAIRNLNRRHWMHTTLRALPLTVLIALAVTLASAGWSWYLFGSGRLLVTPIKSEDGGAWLACQQTHTDKETKTQYCLIAR
jgi:hypothetical protein